MYYFVVPGNGQALLRMPDMAALNIINLKIDSIQAEVAECKTNRVQETHTGLEGCSNMDAGVITKQDANGQNDQINSNKSIIYLYSSTNIDAGKIKSSTMVQKYTKHLATFLMVLGVSKAHSHCSLNPTASRIRHHQGMWHMHYINPSRKSWSTCRVWTSSPHLGWMKQQNGLIALCWYPKQMIW